jgi:Family of unknown function (DUF5906)/RepB DNA-primase from phage plasmid
MNTHVNPPAVLSHDLEQAKRFLEALDPRAERFTFQWFADKSKGEAGHLSETLETAWPKLVALNNRGCGIFVTINETDFKGRTKANIVRARALAIDIDHANNPSDPSDPSGPTRFAKAMTVIRESALKPSITVRSSAEGVHIYWLIDDLPLTQFTPLQKALAAKFGSDPSIHNVDRVLRLPGLFHCKSKPQLVTLHMKSFPPRYMLAEIVKAFGLSVGGSGTAAALGLGSGIALPPNGPQRAALAHRASIAASVAHVLPPRALTAEVKAEVAANEIALAAEWGRGWFDDLPPDRQAACIDAALAHVPHLPQGASTDKGGKLRNSYTLWRECIAAVKNSGVDGGDESARRWSETDPHGRHTDAAFDQAWDSSDGSIGVGTLFAVAQGYGWDSAPWKAKADAARGALFLQAQQATIASGGGLGPIQPRSYDQQTALALMGARHAQVWFDNGGSKELAYVEHGDGGACLLSKEDMAEALSNVFVQVQQDNTQKPVPIFTWWRAQAGRGTARNAVFDPGKPPGVNGAPDEFNFWQGFAVRPLEGEDKIRRLLDHIWRIICKEDQKKYNYLMGWLAWIVQNPTKHPGVGVALHSTKHGAGKSLLGEVMRRIFGDRHSMTLDHPEQFTGNFTGHLEHACFVLLEESLFAGDAKNADVVKARLTANTILINPKYRQPRNIQNHLSVMLCTNNEWAIRAGAGERRWFVASVSEERVGDLAYFNALHDDLENGGDGQFLNYLLKYDLAGWDRRNVPKTAELRAQQEATLRGVPRWLLDCVEEERIVGGRGYDGPQPSLGRDIPSNDLREAFNHWARGHRNERELDARAFNNKLDDILGARKRPRVGGKRERAYSVPSPAELGRIVNEHCGISEKSPDEGPEDGES